GCASLARPPRGDGGEARSSGPGRWSGVVGGPHETRLRQSGRVVKSGRESTPCRGATAASTSIPRMTSAPIDESSPCIEGIRYYRHHRSIREIDKNAKINRGIRSPGRRRSASPDGVGGGRRDRLVLAGRPPPRLRAERDLPT